MNNLHSPDTNADLDEGFWKQAILSRSYYQPDVGFDRYKWALRYGIAARKQHGPGVEFSVIEQELSDGWAAFGGPSGLTWHEARDAVSDSWTRSATLLAESVAAGAGYSKPPTFGTHGDMIPRNLDEPNR